MAGEARRVAVVVAVVCVAAGDNNVGNRLLVRADDDGDNGGDVGGDVHVHEHECECVCVCLRDGVGDKTRQFLANILSCVMLLLLLLLLFLLLLKILVLLLEFSSVAAVSLAALHALTSSSSETNRYDDRSETESVFSR